MRQTCCTCFFFFPLIRDAMKYRSPFCPGPVLFARAETRECDADMREKGNGMRTCRLRSPNKKILPNDRGVYCKRGYKMFLSTIELFRYAFLALQLSLHIYHNVNVNRRKYDLLPPFFLLLFSNACNQSPRFRAHIGVGDFEIFFQISEKMYVFEVGNANNI
ncbi:hypothetical protein PUN28_004450 [Cardiocondyla obscurior]|uniref:Secreted protein n=1 Tax=Cardiocondyla obscurior TaxID=286306 RepID=A0AAW2GDL4_9HYME